MRLIDYISFVFGVLILSWLFYSAVHAEDTKEAQLSILKTEWATVHREMTTKLDAIHQEANGIRKELCAEGRREYCPPVEIHVTSYNPLPEQTDATPCIGAGGDVCAAYEKGLRPMALSQDLVSHSGKKAFKYGDRIEMKSDIVQCNGIFTVVDTMNARFTNKGDLFFPERSMNTSCYATIKLASQ